jgi:LacI family transcriptional regulator
MPDNARRPARLSDVAKLAGVSTSLVSRIVNRDESLRVRDDTRSAVMSAIEMLDYTPHPSARALRLEQTGLLGFALHHANDPVYVEMVASAQRVASDRGYSVILLDTSEVVLGSAGFREIVRKRRVDGMLIQAGFDGSESGLREIARDLPAVLFNSDPIPDVCTIRLDDGRAAEIATEHLIELGHADIVYFGANGSSSGRRYDGYCAAMARAGLQPALAVNGGWDADESHAATRRVFDSGMRATAVVAATTNIALGVHSGLVASGLTIPDDVSLVSVHDTWYAHHLNPALTAVALPFAQLGEAAVRLLIDQSSGSLDGETIVNATPPRLIVRQSTAEPSRRAPVRS